MSSNQRHPSERELVYCHACTEEWWRDEHGLICPRSTCHSDAVEIIERDSDPRGERGRFSHPHDFDGEDDDDNDNGGYRARSTFLQFGGPGLTITSTQQILGGSASASRPPGQSSTGSDDETPLAATEDMVNMFANIVQALIGDSPRPHGQPPRAAGESESPQPSGPEGHQHTRSHARTHAHAHFGAFGPAGFAGSDRFYYDSGARLSPRDADGPQPSGEARVVDLTAILNLLNPREGQEGGGPAMGPASGGLLARLMGMTPGSEGDFVYSQAQLDRVLSQLMEQHQGNAPPPASREAIDSLPKIKVTQQMVTDGDDCTICKEELVFEEEVTQLPCRHSYHFECVSKWLEEHDTCPICRHPITPEEPRRQPQSPQQSRPTVWPFTATPPRSSNESHSSGSSPSTGDRGSGSSSGGRLAGLFRRSHSDRSS